MGYAGQISEIRFGQLGLMYDPAEQDIPQGAMIRADNVQYYNGIAEKAWQINDWIASNPQFENPEFTNEKPLLAHRYFPKPSIERHLVVTNIGNVYRYNNPLQRIPMTANPVNTGPVTLPPSPVQLSVNGLPVAVEGGAEIQGNPKKLFIFSGNTPLQVVYGDNTFYQNIALPAFDWINAGGAPSSPTGGSIYQSRLCAYGNLSNPHTLYISSATNQEDFQTPQTTAFVSVFPGEGDGIYASFVFKSRLFLFKRPYGVYYIETQNSPDPTMWYAQKISNSVGIASPKSYFEGAQDLFFMSSDGTIASFTAVLQLGDIYQGDLLANIGNQSIFRNIIRKQFLFNSFAKYLPQKKIGVFGFPSYKSLDKTCDSFVYIDFNTTTPKVSWHRYTTDTFTDCTFYKDELNQDEFLFAKNHYVNGVYDYGSLGTYYPIWNDSLPFRIQTPHSNLGVPSNKIFDFFELVYESSTAWPLAVDVYIDSKFTETFLVQPYFGEVLGPTIFGPDTPQYSNPEFELDSSEVSGRGSRPKQMKLHGRGQTISFVIRDGDVLTPPYDGLPNPDDDKGSVYTYKIVGIRVYYKVAGQDKKAQTS